jgi:predicted DNA-binding protein (MmcQ/YjbR family)
VPVPPHPLAEPLRTFAFGLPEAWEDHPWGESVAKVGKKVFVFFGIPEEERPFGMAVKLPESSDLALTFSWTTLPGYGLDRGHWVAVTPPDDAPLDMLTEWIEESYRAVAPKALSRRLPARDQGTTGGAPSNGGRMLPKK